MKKTLFLGFIAAAVFSLTSCDLINDAKEAVEDLGKNEAPTYVESKDGLNIQVKYSQGGVATYTVNADFKVDAEGEHLLSDTVCTSFILKEVFSLKASAKTFYESQLSQYENNEEIVLTYDNDKTVTFDYVQFKGEEKPFVIPTLKLLYEGFVATHEEINKQTGK